MGFVLRGKTMWSCSKTCATVGRGTAANPADAADHRRRSRAVKASSGDTRVGDIRGGIKGAFDTVLSPTGGALRDAEKRYQDALPSPSAHAANNRGIFMVVFSLFALLGPGRIDIVDGQARFEVAKSLALQGRCRPEFRSMVQFFPGRGGQPFSYYRFPHSVLGAAAFSVSISAGRKHIPDGISGSCWSAPQRRPPWPVSTSSGSHEPASGTARRSPGLSRDRLDTRLVLRN